MDIRSDTGECYRNNRSFRKRFAGQRTKICIRCLKLGCMNISANSFIRLYIYNLIIWISEMEKIFLFYDYIS
jgi:hypothetical protein